ncbi:beta-CASP ribonuclease aCPSF1 [Candidatus Woesearchaeota archaeon]|nr:beta-CASP ribonuclease aCPSF1 [Candidatus Woesearchaeota archaeon]
MAEILKEILKDIPEKVEISLALFEGANIVLYTKNREFFLDNNGVIKEIVNKIKKRIEVRIDPSMTLDQEKAQEEILKILAGEEAGNVNILFDPQRSQVVIEAEKPGLVIGKAGEVLREIKHKTLWTPLVKRIPAIRSVMIENIRKVLYENNDYRRNFLHKVGERIYANWVSEKREEWIRVSFLGGARQVGRSCLYLQTPESRVLLDCGVNIAASGKDAYPYFESPEFNINALDAVIISHPHLDHCGLVPLLFKMGYRGPVYWTLPTRDIAALLSLDYIGVTFKEAKKALYTAADVKEMVKHSIWLDYEEVCDITPDIRITFYNAGHTLGSAMVHLHIGNGLHNFLYSGDTKYARTKLLEAAVTKFPRLETMTLESTYGGKDNVQPTREECEKQLVEIIKNTVERKGKVLIPVLGVGRAQEMMLIVEELVRKKIIPEVPVFVQGMVWDVTAIHTAYPDFLNNQVKKAIYHHDSNPFLSPIFKQVASAKERQQIIEETGSCIILATSGMLQGGASVEYFRELADNPRNSLVFVSYQGEGSMGRRVQSGERTFVMESNGKRENVEVKMEVYTIEGLSGHSSRNELTRFVYNLDPRPKKIIVVHGESSRCLDLASSLHKLNKIETVAPKNLEAVRIR